MSNIAFYVSQHFKCLWKFQHFHYGFQIWIASNFVRIMCFLWWKEGNWIPLLCRRLWISEERRWQEELSSLGDLCDQWHTRQMALLNQHVTLINIYTMALDVLHLAANSGAKKKLLAMIAVHFWFTCLNIMILVLYITFTLILTGNNIMAGLCIQSF